MNKIYNPFNPGPGAPPPALVGREDVLEEIDVAVQRLQKQMGITPQILVGLRGVGKTVVLVKAEENAQARGAITYRFEVDEATEYDFKKTIFTKLQAALFKIDTIENLKQTFRRQLSILKNISVSLGDVELKMGIDLEPVYGEGDSGIFADDLMTMMREIGILAKSKNKVICLFIDELQNLAKEDLAALLGAIHRMIQETLPIYVLGAGLPSLHRKIAEAKSYAERFQVIRIGPLSVKTSAEAITIPLEKKDVKINQDALDLLIEETGRYPYFIQQFGKSAWAEAKSSPITLEDVIASMPDSLAELDRSFFKTRYDRSTEAERLFLICMAKIGTQGPYKMEDINTCLKKQNNQTAPVRSSLINKGFIYPTEHGKVDFTVPLFAEFLKRTAM